MCKDLVEANFLWILVPFMLEMKKNKTKQNKNTWCNFLSLVSSTMSKHIFIKKERSKPSQTFSKVFPTLFGVPYNELLFRTQAPGTDCLPSLF